jgi:purine-cytosine permease-like protein
VGACPTTVLNAAPHTPFLSALTSVSSFVIGFAVWGNEADYWRYGKPDKWLAALPLTVALAIGQVIFPVTGWMVARMSGITEYGAATSFINSYSFGGVAAFAAIVLVASYFACNDSNLYGMINAIENLKALPHHAVCAVLAALCAAFSAWLSTAGITKSLEAIASLNCVFLPTVTVVMIAEFFVVSRLIGSGRDLTRVSSLSELPRVRWPGIVALLVGFAVGVATSGIVPGTAALHVGICSVQAWIAAALVYVPLRLIEHKVEVDSRRLYLSDTSIPAVAAVEYELSGRGQDRP